MASACADDVARLGPNNVVALCATHEEAEQLADAIRLRLRASGALRGPELCGPGWSRPRGYGAGDRVLIHSTLRVGGAALHNGDVVTIRAAAPGGISVRRDGGEELMLAYDFVRGRRDDGNPNLSHAWARTIDGAQGGTWDQVHLLASCALDHQRAYVGQSRGRRPTHTWYARKPPETDHGGHLVQAPNASESVAAAMERNGSQRFAAAEDPYRKDRVLREEKAKHLAALVALSPERSAEREKCRRRIEELALELEEHWASSVLAATREGDPLAFGRDKLAEAIRAVEHELNPRERIDHSPKHGQAGAGAETPGTRDAQWSDRELAELHFASSFAARRAITECVLERAGGNRAKDDERRRKRNRSVQRSRGAKDWGDECERSSEGGGLLSLLDLGEC